MNVLVVGAGAMGVWFGEALVSGASESVSLAYADADAEVAAAAAEEASDSARSVPLDTTETFELVCIAVPLPAATDAIADHAANVGRAMVDVTGSATEPIEAMREHASDGERVGLHPLFAPENAPGNVAVVSDATGPVTDRVRATLSARGNDLFETTAAEHDRTMETVQARAHAAVLSFGLAAEEVPEGFQTPVSGALFDLIEQVTGGDPRVYADIQDAFDGAEDVAQAARALADADAESFTELYERVRETDFEE